LEGILCELLSLQAVPSPSHFSERSRNYEGSSRLGNTQPGDGALFAGRGYVQITGRSNYQHWASELGVDFVGHPDLASAPDYAAQIAVRGMNEGAFSGHSLSEYINTQSTDFYDARQVVNGLDHASEIAGFARTYSSALTGW